MSHSTSKALRRQEGDKQSEMYALWFPNVFYVE